MGELLPTRRAGLAEIFVPSAPISPKVVLSRPEIRSWAQNGFLSISNVSTPDELRWLTDTYDRMFEERVGYEEGYLVDFAGEETSNQMQLPQLLGPVAYRPEFRNMAIWRNCESIARQLIGDDAVFRFDHLLTKPADGGVPTPWHQDQAFYPRGTHYETITFWIPLQDVGPSDGCLKYVAGSHNGPLHEHRSIGGNPRIHGLEALNVDEGDKVQYCPLPAGGAVVHHRLTLHGADANVSSTPRRAYGVAFGIRKRSVVVPKDYAWNLAKITAGGARLRASPVRRARQAMKRGLMYWGLLDR